MSEHRIFGVDFDSEDVSLIKIKRDGRTITIEKDEDQATIKGFAAVNDKKDGDTTQ